MEGRMDSAELARRIAAHLAWRRREGGERLDLSGADLREADLSWADLNGADLSWADLRGAGLSGAGLSGAGLSGADLSWADLRGADLSGADLSWAVGIAHPPVNDPRGYRCIAVWHADGWRIAAGCRWFTLAEARAHWGDGYAGNRAIGDAYLRALEWLTEQPTL
jgi:hypothetical protein